MKNDHLIAIHTNILKDAENKRDAAWLDGNFAAVNKWTTVIVRTQLILKRLEEE